MRSGDQNSPSFPGKIDNTELFDGESGSVKGFDGSVTDFSRKRRLARVGSNK